MKRYFDKILVSESLLWESDTENINNGNKICFLENITKSDKPLGRSTPPPHEDDISQK